jgi:hypothetical protein
MKEMSNSRAERKLKGEEIENARDKEVRGAGSLKDCARYLRYIGR